MMQLILKVHYSSGPLLSYIEAPAKDNKNLHANYEYGFLCFADGLKIKVKDIRNVTYDWKEVPTGKVE